MTHTAPDPAPPTPQPLEPQPPPQGAIVVEMDPESLTVALDQMTGMYANAVRELVMYRAAAESLQRRYNALVAERA